MLDIAATRAVDQAAQRLTELAQKIWETPETAYNEVNACQWLADYLRQQGFTVEVGYAGLPRRSAPRKILSLPAHPARAAVIICWA